MLNQKNPFLCTICVTAQASGLVIPQTLCVDKISLRFSLGTNFAAKKALHQLLFHYTYLHFCDDTMKTKVVVFNTKCNRNFFWGAGDPIPITRLFKAVFTAHASTCKLPSSFLCPVGQDRHKSTTVLLSAFKRALFYTMPLSASKDTDKQESVH